MQCMLFVKILLKQKQVRNLEVLPRQKLEILQESYISHDILFIINKVIHISGKAQGQFQSMKINILVKHNGVYVRVHACCLQPAQNSK